MKKVASGVAKKILALLVTVLVLCAILIGVVRELVHQIDDFKPELVAFVNQKTGMYLSIETIKGSWTGLVPRFLVHDISLRAEAGSEPLMSAKTVDFELLLIRSVKNRQPRFRLNIDGAELHAEYKDGRFSLRGFTPDKKQSKEKLEEVVESIAVGQNWDDDVRVVLFVVLRSGVSIDDNLRGRICRVIRENTTPRHVPAKIVAVADIPRTKSGKIVELAVRSVVHDESVKNTEALANPEALEYFRNIAELGEA